MAFWTLPIFPYPPKITLFLNGQPMKRLVDTGADATILTENVALHFPPRRHKQGLPISNMGGGQQNSKMTTHLVHWKDLNGNTGAIQPIIANVHHHNLWGRDTLEVWLLIQDICVKPWLIIETKVSILKILITEQLRLGHEEPSINKYNNLIFLTPKKSGKYHLLQGPRATNDQMGRLVSAQTGLSLFSTVPWYGKPCQICVAFDG